MRIWDCHCHSMGNETGAEVLRWMDQAKVDRISLLSHPCEDGRRPTMRRAIDHAASVQASDPSRKDIALLRDVIGVSQTGVETYFWGACKNFFDG